MQMQPGWDYTGSAGPVDSIASEVQITHRLNATSQLLDRWASPTATQSRCCGRPLSGNAKTLIVSVSCCLALTISQFIAAFIAQSISLQADCVSMFVDALSYCGSLAAELTASPSSKERLELIASGLSLGLLIGLTSFFIVDAARRINTPDNGRDVNGYIVLVFALLGIAMDVSTLVLYAYWSKQQPGTRNINMVSAMAHVSSDLMRSTTTLVESILLLNYPHWNEEELDAWCALIVCSLIALGAVSAISLWIRQLCRYRQSYERVTPDSGRSAGAAPGVYKGLEWEGGADEDVQQESEALRDARLPPQDQLKTVTHQVT